MLALYIVKIGVAKKTFYKAPPTSSKPKGTRGVDKTRLMWDDRTGEADVPFSGAGLYYYSNALEYSATLELCSVDEKVKNTK